MGINRLNRSTTGLIVVDMQDKFLPFLDRTKEVLKAQTMAVKGFSLLNIPIVVSEQYPKGLGHTAKEIASCLPQSQDYITKASFSCCGERKLYDYFLQSSVTQWVVIGIEAHVCVLQTVRDLLNQNKEVTILADAVTSRYPINWQSAINEMRVWGARISTVETVLFELLESSEAPEFRQISELVK